MAYFLSVMSASVLEAGEPESTSLYAVLINCIIVGPDRPCSLLSNRIFNEIGIILISILHSPGICITEYSVYSVFQN